MFIPEQIHKHMTHLFYELEQFSTNSQSTSLIGFGDLSLNESHQPHRFLNVAQILCIYVDTNIYGVQLAYISSKFTKSVTYPKIAQAKIQVWSDLTDLVRYKIDFSSSSYEGTCTFKIMLVIDRHNPHLSKYPHIYH